jgi:hypothetical protein
VTSAEGFRIFRCDASLPGELRSSGDGTIILLFCRACHAVDRAAAVDLSTSQRGLGAYHAPANSGRRNKALRWCRY